MEKTNETLTSEERGAYSGLYVGGVYIILYFTLKEGFSIANPIAHAIGMSVAFLSVYPIFIRGTEIRWKRDKKWTFLIWLITFVIPVTVFAFIFPTLVHWLMN